MNSDETASVALTVLTYKVWHDDEHPGVRVRMKTLHSDTLTFALANVQCDRYKTGSEKAPAPEQVGFDTCGSGESDVSQSVW